MAAMESRVTRAKGTIGAKLATAADAVPFVAAFRSSVEFSYPAV